MIIKRHTLKSKITVGLMAILVPLISFLLFNNIYGIHQLNKQVLASNKNVIRIITGNMEEKLDNIEQYMASVVVDSDNLNILDKQKENPSDDEIINRNYAVWQLDAELKRIKQINPYLTGIMAYTPNSDIIVGDFGSTEKAQVIENLKASVEDTEESLENYQKNWRFMTIHNQQYIMLIKRFDTKYVAGWIRGDALLESLESQQLSLIDRLFIQSAKGELVSDFDCRAKLFADPAGFVLDENAVIVKTPFCNNAFTLNAVIDEKNIMQGLNTLQWIIFVIAVLSIFIIPLAYIILNRTVIHPIQRLANAMREFKGGNLERTISVEENSEEFRVLNQTFNDMTKEIHTLKIGIYEEKIQTQKVELQYLRMQIKPHFLLNTLNIIYSFSITQNIEAVKDTLLSLIKYCRTILRDDMQFMRIEEEAAHLGNYLHILELRYDRHFSYYIEIEGGVEKAPILPLMLQTFVENSIKHGNVENYDIEISVEISRTWIGDIPFIRISIIDTGEGFDSEIMDKINCGKEIGEGHIGIYNISQRLRIVYGEKAGLHVENRPLGGAKVTIEYPDQRKNDCV